MHMYIPSLFPQRPVKQHQTQDRVSGSTCVTTTTPLQWTASSSSMEDVWAIRTTLKMKGTVCRVAAPKVRKNKHNMTFANVHRCPCNTRANSGFGGFDPTFNYGFSWGFQMTRKRKNTYFLWEATVFVFNEAPYNSHRERDCNCFTKCNSCSTWDSCGTPRMNITYIILCVSLLSFQLCAVCLWMLSPAQGSLPSGFLTPPLVCVWPTKAASARPTATSSTARQSVRSTAGWWKMVRK